MSNELPSSQHQHLHAQQMVDRFVRCFEPSYRLLLEHAALPLVLTPELVNYLRNQFLRSENVPWIAEVYLLLSDLCRQVGYEQYVLETDVRIYLLAEMQKKQSGRQRAQEIAQLLIAYFQHLAATNPYIRPHELETQQWAAMVYLDDQRETAVRQIAQSYQNASSLGANTSQINRAEMARLSRITKELEEQLKKEPEKYREFLEYAKLITKLIAGSIVDNNALNRPYSTLGVELPAPVALIPGYTPDKPPLQTFEFDVATVEVKKEGRRQPQIIITRRRHQAQYFTENLPNNVTLDMVAIPGGTFTMGAPKTEAESSDDERPQHQVTVSPFFMGKYTITQAQSRAVATLPQVTRELNPDPSTFKGENLPVECVTWYDAVEFCDRLSKYTQKNYRLPSEAEWEYACRAGTTTPFHFGETITPELANYDGNYTYNSGSKGQYRYREKTTPVGSSQVANVFGLFDMHGNVWEWCSDDWHDSYKNAPADGSSWLQRDLKENENDNQYLNKIKMLRGGSSDYNPPDCRSASRSHCNNDNDDIGFRVVVVGARTL
jgi:formylglycine-generating enzyme required for sulfatase activity